MKKQILLTLLLVFSTLFTWAEQVDEATARAVALRVAQRQLSVSQLRSSGPLKLVYVAEELQTPSRLRNADTTPLADFYVYNLSQEGGFVIVAADDRVQPVLGYSSTGSFQPASMPDNLKGWLRGYQEQIKWARNHVETADPIIQKAWNTHLRASFGKDTVREIVLKTADWGQGGPYFNLMTPKIAGEHTLVGCVATAAAIVMRYHQWPSAITNGVSKHPLADEHPEWECYPLVYENYQWEKMPLQVKPNDPEEVQRELSQLMWHVGANVNMVYDKAFSGTQQHLIADFLRANGYSQAIQVKYRSDVFGSAWNDIVRKEIDAERPLVYGGCDIAGIGHAFVCDGYNSDGFFHFNWGWNGRMNGFYALSSLLDRYDFRYFQDIVYGIEKDKGQKAPMQLMITESPRLVGHTTLPVGVDFDMNLYFYNTGVDSIPYFRAGVAIYDFDEQDITSVLALGKAVQGLPPNYGWFGESAYDVTKVRLKRPLESQEVLIPFYTFDDKKWKMFDCPPNIPSLFKMNGLMVYEYTENYMDVLNGKTFAANQEIKNKHFSFSWVMRRDTTSHYSIRFQLDPNKSWKDLLFVTVKNLFVPIDKDGCFYIPDKLLSDVRYFDMCEISFALSLKPLSDFTGEVSYKVDICDADKKKRVSVGEGRFWIQSDDPTSIAEVDPSGLRVWGQDGCLRIVTDKPYETAQVVTLDGRIVQVLPLPIGETVVNLSRGVYVVRIGERRYKIRL